MKIKLSEAIKLIEDQTGKKVSLKDKAVLKEEIYKITQPEEIKMVLISNIKDPNVLKDIDWVLDGATDGYEGISVHFKKSHRNSLTKKELANIKGLTYVSINKFNQLMVFIK